MFKKIAQYVNYRRTVRELAALDNVQLIDVGIYRGDIKAIARGKAF
jgi:uncharacterized protein YjiS (DUF1127 family)